MHLSYFEGHFGQAALLSIPLTILLYPGVEDGLSITAYQINLPPVFFTFPVICMAYDPGTIHESWDGDFCYLITFAN